MAWGLVVEGINDGRQDAAIEAAQPSPEKLLSEELSQVESAKACLKAALAGMFIGAQYRASVTGTSWNGGGSLNFAINAIAPDEVAAMTAAGITPIGITPVIEPPQLG
jgi:hypothetical protein